MSSRVSPYVGSMYPSVVVGPTTVDMLLGRAGPWPNWLWGCASCSGCRPAGEKGRFSVSLAVCPGEPGAGSLHSCLCSLGWFTAGASPQVGAKSPGASRVGGGFQNGTCQCWCYCSRTSPQKWLPPASLSPRGSQLPLASPGGSPRPASGSDPDSFHTAASALELGLCEILCMLFKGGISVSYSFQLSWTWTPLVFKARCSVVLSSWCRISGLESLTWHSDPLLFGEDL